MPISSYRNNQSRCQSTKSTFDNSNSKMSNAVDTELKKAFQDLQVQLIDTKRKSLLSDEEIEFLNRRKQHAIFTEREMDILEPETKTYEFVGRMFLLKPLDDLKKQLKMKQAEADVRIKTLAKQKQYLTKRLKDAEDNLREMVRQKQEAWTKPNSS